MWWCCLLAALTSGLSQAQGNYIVEGGEYNVGGMLPGEQMYPAVSLKTTGGYLVWQDNITDGAGLGISARKLDGTLSGVMSPFRVNAQGAYDQERPAVSMLNDGGAMFVWQGGRQGFQHIYGRLLSSGGTWLTNDFSVSTATNVYQLEPAVTTLVGGNVVVAWSSFNQVFSNSLRDVYFQQFTPTGAKVGSETRVNQAVTYNQRAPAISRLSDGRFVVVWISEQQRFENSVDVVARIYDSSAAPVTGEFMINLNTNVCANPSVAPSSDGGFAVTWMERDLVTRSNSWDVFSRTYNSGGTGGDTRRVNTQVLGDQFGPKISSLGTDYLIVWTSLGQDGSREGVYGQFIRGDGTPFGGEFRANTTTVSQQMHPAVASDGAGQFLAVWTSYTGGASTFDLFAQRYYNTNAALAAPGAPLVTVLSSNALSVTWPPVQGLGVASYEVYADGGVAPGAIVTNNFWTAAGLVPSSTHSFQLAYVLTDGRRSPLSGATTNATYSAGTHGGIPRDWVIFFFGDDSELWPSAAADSDGDGASNRQEFLAGTDPTDANSVLKQRMVQTPQGPYLNWNTQPGLIYQVQRTTNMSNWQNVGGPRFAAGYLDSLYVGGSNAGFYQIVRLR